MGFLACQSLPRTPWSQGASLQDIRIPGSLLGPSSRSGSVQSPRYQARFWGLRFRTGDVDSVAVSYQRCWAEMLEEQGADFLRYFGM